VDERLLRVFLRQHASGFADLRGADAAVTLPVSERLLNEAIAEVMPRSAPVRDLHVRPMADDRFAVRLRIGSSPLLPAITLTLSIERQPDFPTSPVLILRMERTGLLAIAGPALRFLNALPAGIRVEHDRIYVDLLRLLEVRGLAHYLGYINELNVNTVEGALIVSFRASISTTA
jgi:hypothetical protein